jgi:hypothetical protein
MRGNDCITPLSAISLDEIDRTIQAIEKCQRRCNSG